MRWQALVFSFLGLLLVYGTQTLMHTRFALADESKSPRNSTNKLRSEPLSPQQSLAMFSVAEGYQVKLLAHEPEVIDPVDVAFDDRGRMWVVEMIDYPNREPENAPLRGRVRVLTDTDQDGRFEKSETFADQLDMPNGLAFWRDGVLVTLAGKLVFMRDANGDNKVDDQQVWLSGFALSNEQLRANHPRLGPDGWWYIACGLRGGKLVVGPGSGTENPTDFVFDIGSRDIRYNPGTNKAEPVTGPAQFGLTWDDCGTRMFCSNRNPCTQVLFEQLDLESNPLAGIIPSTRDVLPSGEASRVHPIAPSWTTSNLHAGQFTAACGVFFAQRPSLSEDVLGDAYACEPTGSLVHRRTVSHDGVTWTPLGELPSQEWLASRDEWFRPVDVVAAPGGGVIIVDMHRAVIEHPQWVPDELKKRPDQRWGDAAGRIFWAGEKEKSWPSAMLRQLSNRPLSQRSSQELAGLISSDDLWLRQMATRILMEREARDVAPELERIVASSQAVSSARCAALFLLARVATIPSTTFGDALTAANRAVRVAALRSIDRGYTPDSQSVQRVLELATATTDPWVRMEAVLGLARCQHSSSIRLTSEQIGQLANLAANHAEDAPLLIAVSAACKRDVKVMLARWLESLSLPTEKGKTPEHISIAAKKLGESVLREEPAAWSEIHKIGEEILNTSSKDVRKVAALASFTQWASMNKKNRRAESAKGSSASPQDPGASLWSVVREICQSTDVAGDIQIAAIELLGFSPNVEDAQLLGSLVRSKSSSAVRLKALRAWSESGATECDDFLISELALSGPQSQPTLFELILARPGRMQGLLERLESKAMTAKQIGAVQLGKLVERATGELQDGFKRHLDKIANSDRAGVITDYSSCLTLVGQPQRGREIFTRHCAACHKIDTVGVAVGPDISDSRTQKPIQILTSILDPNRAIDNNYFRYVVLTDDGRTLEGIISEETADSIVLRSQNDVRHAIRRESIEVLKATGVSMMPEGVESQIDKQSMADLISFVKGWRYMDGSVPATN